MTTTTPKKRGFGAMHPDKVKQLASKGGKAAVAKGVNHRWTSDEARAAGKKGGVATHARKRAAKAAKLAQSPTPKDDGMEEVQVGCSSASGCEGTIKVPKNAKLAQSPTTKAPTSDDQAIKDGASADENPNEMGSCGSAGGCGSH